MRAVNFYREMAGLTPVSFDPAFSADAQQAALMMDAQNSLSHSPDPSWACYTAAGARGAGRSNLYLGVTGARAIAGYIDDPGSNNYAVGHRRWILYPPQSSMGSGSTSRSNALYVLGGQNATAPPPAWIPWPTAEYFPFQAEPEGRWSLSASNTSTDFTNAQVTVTSNGAQLPVTLQPIVNGYGNRTLVWELAHGYGNGRADRAYDVSVTNIIQNGATVSHQYTVRLFDAEINADQSISFPGPADRVYGDPPSTLTATASSGLPVTFTSTTTAVCTTSGAQGEIVTPVGAGTCTIRADQPGDATRNPAPPVQRTFQVAKKALTVKAVDVARSVGVANPPLTVSYTGFAYGQTLAGSGVAGAPSCTTTATVQSPAGTYPITCGLGTLVSGNYTFILAPGTLVVGHSYVPLSPARLADTRPGASTVDGGSAGGGPVQAGSSVNVTVTGRGGVPRSGVGAVVLNVTAVAPTASSYVTVWPAGEAQPLASNLNLTPGQTLPNVVVAKVGSDGQVSIFNAAGSTHLILDVAGWFP